MLIIGIAGGTGSGKTTVVKGIIEKLPPDKVSVISQDAYYKDNSHIPPEDRQKINFDHPDAIEFDLLIEHILDLKAGKSVERPVYSYLTCTRQEETVTIPAHEVIIVEGILIYTCKRLRDLCSVKIFVSAADDDRLARVIQRDIIERGRTVEKVLDRYEKLIKPMHNQFIEPTKRYADIIVPQGGHNTVAIDILRTIIEQRLIKN